MAKNSPSGENFIKWIWEAVLEIKQINNFQGKINKWHSITPLNYTQQFPQIIKLSNNMLYTHF